MILSKNWLINLNPKFKLLDSEKLNVALNCLGQELEGTREHFQVNDLCVGYVKDFYPHPNSDHLNVVTIETQKDERTIVCGAPHMYKDRYVCVANVGSTMANGMTLIAKPLRGVDSCGMICAFHELTNTHIEALSKKEKDNVIFLDDDARINTNIYRYLGLDDEMYDIFIQANRNDLNGAFYLGRSLAAYFDIEYPTLDKEIPEITKENVIVKTDLVTGYGLLKVRAEDQPLKWKDKKTLINGCVKTKDNISDYASYLSYAFAVPYLALDASKVQLPLTITTATSETTWIVDDKKIDIKVGDIVCLDNNQKIVTYGNLIANPEYVSETASDIYLLSFNADILTTRKMVSQNKISNQNSLLAVKPNTNMMIINSQQYAIDKEISPDCFNGLTKVLASCPKNKGNSIEVTVEEVNRFLGTNISYDQYKEILTKYGFKVSKEKVTSSPVRTDLSSVQDVAEDVLVGFNLNDMDVQPINFDVKETYDDTYDKTQKIVQYLVDNGFYNAKTYNLTSLEDANRFNWYNLQIQRLKNPSSNIKAAFNTNKIDALLNVIGYNNRAKNNPVNWFEIAKLYRSKKNGFNVLTIILNNDWYVDNLTDSKISNSILNAIAIVNNIFKIANKPALTGNDLVYNLDLDGCYKDNSIAIQVKNKVVGYIGEITKNILKDYKITNNVFAISLNLDTLWELNDKSSVVQTISNFNDVVRSVNILADFDVNLENVVDEFKNIENVVAAQVIDKYNDEKGNSYIVEYVINNNERQLDSHDLDQVQNEVMSILTSRNLKLK